VPGDNKTNSLSHFKETFILGSTFLCFFIADGLDLPGVGTLGYYNRQYNSDIVGISSHFHPISVADEIPFYHLP